MGVPCIVTDIRGCRETVEHGRNGWLVPRRNANQLSDAISVLLLNPAIINHMGEQAHIKALNEFDEQLVFNRVKNEYSRLVMAKL